MLYFSIARQSRTCLDVSPDRLVLKSIIFYFGYNKSRKSTALLIYIFRFSMASLKKNFSMSKLYSDLQKYESNLHTFKESRVRQNGHASSSLHKPASKKYGDYPTVQHARNVDRFNKYSNGDLQKNRLEIKTKYSRQPRQTFEIEGSSKVNHYESQINYSGITANLINLQKENFQQSRLLKSPKFSRTDELRFLSECQNMYGNQSIPKEVQEGDTVKCLLKEINKRDEIYELVANRLGRENTVEALRKFFENFQRKKAIIAEFKKMSKLSIEDDEELYDVLRSEEQIECEEVNEVNKQQS